MTDATRALRPVCGAVLLDATGRVLLVRRRDDGTWGLPGGGVEVGESWEAACRRECLEETGWEVELDGLLGVYSDPATQTHRYPDGRTVQFLGVVFRGRLLARPGSPGDEVLEVGAFHLADLPEPLFDPDRPVLDDAGSCASSPFLR